MSTDGVGWAGWHGTIQLAYPFAMLKTLHLSGIGCKSVLILDLSGLVGQAGWRVARPACSSTRLVADVRFVSNELDM
jgi:hypothetical protein